jgi:hypothetical protein
MTAEASFSFEEVSDEFFIKHFQIEG